MQRRPDHQAPPTTTSDVILGGIAKCGGCGGALSAATGTGKLGAVYNYYVCSNRAARGDAACANPQTVRREELDEAVISALTGRLLQPERLQVLTNAVAKRRELGQGDFAEKIAGAKLTLAAVEKNLTNLVKAVIRGTLTETATVRKMQKDL